MNMMELVGKVLNYISEGVGRIFSPLEDHYPATGILPFDGEITHDYWSE